MNLECIGGPYDGEWRDLDPDRDYLEVFAPSAPIMNAVTGAPTGLTIRRFVGLYQRSEWHYQVVALWVPA